MWVKISTFRVDRYGAKIRFFFLITQLFLEKGSPSLISKKEEPVYVPFLAKIQLLKRDGFLLGYV